MRLIDKNDSLRRERIEKVVFVDMNTLALVSIGYIRKCVVHMLHSLAENYGICKQIRLCK